MRAMVIGHSYCAPINHQKLRALATLFPGPMRVVTPRDWRDMLLTVSTAGMPRPAEYGLSRIPIVCNGRESIFLYDQIRLERLLRREQPQLVHISQDPRMLSCWQCVATVRRVMGDRCRIIVIAQENDPAVRVRLPNRCGRDYVLRNIDWLIAGNPGALDLARQLGYAGPARVLSHFGVDPTVFAPRPPAPAPARPVRIGYIGRFVWYKGIDTLIKASAIATTPHELRLLGRGPSRPTLQRLVRQLRLDERVSFHDSVTAEQVPTLLHDLDLVVLPSVCQEQFGRVLVEAMSCGVPVVGAESGAIPWVIGDAGLTFPANDHHRLAELIDRLFGDRQLWHDLSRRGRRRVMENFTYDVVGRRTVDIWNDALAGPRQGPSRGAATGAPRRRQLPRVALIGHSYCAPINHQKIAAIAASQRYELHLIMPSEWRQTLHTVSASDRNPLGDYCQWSLPIYLNGHETMFLYHPNRFYTLIRTLRPDLVQVEQDPRMLSCCQAVSTIHRELGGRCRITVVAQENQKVLVSPFHKLAREYVYRSIDSLVAGNPGALELARSKGYRGPGAVLPHLGIDADEFSAAADRGGATGALTIGFIGRLEWYKGLETLIRAFATLGPSHTLALIGKGPYEPAIRQLARRLGVHDRVEIVGNVSHEQMPAQIRRLDVVVLPSLTTPHWKEQFGHVLIEAMSCQVPVVGSDSGAIPWVIGDGGLVFREGDHRDLAGKLGRLCGDAALRLRLGAAGRARVIGHFTHDVIARQTMALWDALLH